MRILLLIVLLLPVSSFAQFKLKGIVRDSQTQEVLPGTNVTIENSDKTTVTNVDGEFEIESPKSSAHVTFSFIGFITTTHLINSSTPVTINLAIDSALLQEEHTHFIKSSLDVGYFGDVKYASSGFIAQYSLQSIGNTTIEMNTGFKYWKEKNNSGMDISLSKDLSGKINFIADNLYLNYRSFDYDQQIFSLKQTRALVMNQLPRFFAVDAGVSYNELAGANEQVITNKYYFAGILGVAKTFNYFGLLRSFGLYGNLTYHPQHVFYEAAVYKNIHIKKLAYMVLMAKYYDYDDLSGVMISLRVNIFSTRYYCCYSWKVHSDYVDALR